MDIALKIKIQKFAQRKVKNFFETLFSFNNIENNLIYLDIDFTNYETKNDLFKKIDNFKLLRY